MALLKLACLVLQVVPVWRILQTGKFLRKKQAKNWHFFSLKAGEKRAKLEFYKKKNGLFQVFLFPSSLQ
jgi:hypothetical protein